MNRSRVITFAAAINEALDQSLAADHDVMVMGLGVPDPVGVFGTTKGLAEKYGANRVWDMPISENGMTGICLGASLTGMRPVMTHMRLEFAMLAIDQIVNQAAKWHYMFGGQSTAPITVRMIVGRGWGQGPQHSQSLHAWFSHIPGLKVVMPATPADAKGLLVASIKDDSPVIFIEHRWLYSINGPVDPEYVSTPLGSPRIVQDGSDVTIVASSFMTLEAVKAAAKLKRQEISAEVIDLRVLNPLDDTQILESVSKTGRLVVCDQGTYSAGYAGEIISRVCEQALDRLVAKPMRITLPDTPTPTSRALSNYYYPGPDHIAAAVRQTLDLPFEDPFESIAPDDLLDVPDKSFTGPF